MLFHLKIKNKQGNRLNATINATSLSEAHEKVIKKGYEIVIENTNDLMDTMIINPVDKEIIQKMQVDQDQKEDAKAIAQLKADPNSIPPEKKNRRQERRIRGKRSQSTSQVLAFNRIYLYIATCPTLIYLIILILSYFEIETGSYSKLILIVILATTVISLYCSIVSLRHGLKYLKKMILGISSVLILLNLFIFYIAGFSIYRLDQLEKAISSMQNELFGNNSNFSFGGKELDNMYTVKLVDGKIFLHYVKSLNSREDSGPYLKIQTGEFKYTHSVGFQRIYKEGNDWYFVIDKGDMWKPCKVLNGEILDNFK